MLEMTSWSFNLMSPEEVLPLILKQLIMGGTTLGQNPKSEG